MTNFPPVTRALRRVLAAVAGSLVISHSSLVIAATAAPSAVVAAVQPTRVADLVMLNSGFDAGLRQGMICRISRSGADIGEVLLVDVRPICSAALILDLASEQQPIRAGDHAFIKVLKS